MSDIHRLPPSSNRTLADRVSALFAGFGAKSAKVVDFPARPDVPAPASQPASDSVPCNVAVMPRTDAQAKAATPPVRVRHEPAPALDAETVRGLEKLGGSPGFAMTALGIFADDCTTLLGEIECAMKERRFQAARDAAQALKGNASCVGAVAMMAASTRIIRADITMLCRDGDKIVRELRRAFDRVASDIEMLRDSNRRERA